MDNFLQSVALFGPMLLFSVIAHEIAHGYAALKQGDPTAYQLGRLTWNPVKHIDPFLTILLPLLLYFTTGAAIGGAKPVPVNPRNYRKFKRGDIIVSLAGVATNLAIAIGCVILIPVLRGLANVVPVLASTVEIAQAVLVLGILLNWNLIIFNLLPIPPLDGSHVIKYLLPPAWSMKYAEFGARYGFYILIGLFLVGRNALGSLLTPAYIMSDLFIRSVQSFILPNVSSWLQ